MSRDRRSARRACSVISTSGKGGRPSSAPTSIDPGGATRRARAATASRIRDRAGRLGKAWDDTKSLGFRAFLAQERGAYGAIGNSYSSLYLWLEDEGAVDFIADERFQAVTGTFGRPSIETWLPFDLHLGRASGASALQREDVPIDASTHIAAIRHTEGERNMALARRAGTFAAITAIDLSSWRLSRFLLSAQAADRPENGSVHEVLHLAKPGMPALPAAA